MKKIILIATAMLVVSGAFAQNQTAEELKAEREALKAELTSKDAAKKGKAIAKKIDAIAPVGGNMGDLVTNMTASLPEALKASVIAPLNTLLDGKDSRIVNKPAATSLASVDGIVDAISPLLAISIATNDIMAEYKTEIIDSGNGEIDITKYKANTGDYAAILPLLVQAGADAAKSAEKLKDVKNDVSKLNPMQAGPTIKAANWASDAIDVTSYKLSETTKLLQNLVNTLKASENL